jgi:hypothetical protein
MVSVFEQPLLESTVIVSTSHPINPAELYAPDVTTLGDPDHVPGVITPGLLFRLTVNGEHDRILEPANALGFFLKLTGTTLETVEQRLHVTSTE